MKKFNLLLVALFAFATVAFAQAPIKVACVGNSITQGPGRDNPESYPLQMQAILGDAYEVANFGVSGRTLLRKGDYPYWNEPQFQQVKDFQADILVIMLGTNDSKPQNWKYASEFRQDYLDMIAEFKKTMPADGKVYVIMPVPVTRENFGITPEVMNNEQRMMIMDIARDSGSELVDLYTPLMDKADLLPDGVHPNTEGLGIMASVIARAIRL
ncbi:GDSL-type esterase/lipase family protein [Algoriphagus sp. D3-2-R+10]|uniref:GDSL-type esterase/lipase family protein n=1 Tax=Algoriphagus aurantiacus TaxID=3103948 RepID=UPI002B3FB123|nr:GDSL-type esterase/lipase family protein [Algoriphagus sp. D3-2-R+10]MEB2776123.1 GDSL-type esterase/lipase family protein [Algoriphagus sp. D3-2-R+10]